MVKYLFSLMMVLLATQCDDEALPQLQEAAVFGKAFLLEQERDQEVTGERIPPVTVQLYSLSDSRCPEDVVCVWMGNATAVLKVSDADEKNVKLEFCIGNCRPDPIRNKHTVRAVLGNQAYDFTLLEVLPYPNTKNAAQANQVKLLVEAVNQAP